MKKLKMVGTYQGVSGQTIRHEGKDVGMMYIGAAFQQHEFTKSQMRSDANSLRLGAPEERYLQLKDRLVQPIYTFGSDCRPKTAVNQFGTLYLEAIDHIDLIVSRLGGQFAKIDTERVRQLKKDLICALQEMIGGNASYFIPRKDMNSGNGELTEEWLLWQEVQREAFQRQDSDANITLSKILNRNSRYGDSFEGFLKH